MFKRFNEVKNIWINLTLEKKIKKKSKLYASNFCN